MTREKAEILVTGGAGYIGTHTVLALQQAGYRVVILDNLSQGHQALVETVLKAELVVGDIRDRSLLDRLFEMHEFIGVVHLAGSALLFDILSHAWRWHQQQSGVRNIQKIK
jgi:UDP-glucose 4-epimerase